MLLPFSMDCCSKLIVYHEIRYRNAKLVTRPHLGSNNLPSLLTPWHKVVTRLSIGCKVVNWLQQPCNHLRTISNPGFVRICARSVQGWYMVCYSNSNSVSYFKGYCK